MCILCMQFTGNSGLQQVIKTSEIKPEMLFCLCPAPPAFLCSHYHSGKQSVISCVGKILSSLHISYTTQETVLLCFFSFNLSSRKIQKLFILFLMLWSFLIKVNCLLFPEVIFSVALS